MEESFYIWKYWLLAGVVCIVAEMFLGNFFFLFVSISCIICAICAALGLCFPLQILVFIFCFFVGLHFFTKKKKTKKSNSTISNTINIVGKTGIVISTIKEYGEGLVQIENQTWTASSLDQKEIRQGTRIYINDIQGVRLIVSAIN